jgi:glucose-6-phosphate 1-dehydrogenase
VSPIDSSHVVRGQYSGYLDEPGVAPHSETETFIALKCYIDNWRWAGVPFYLRTGKRLAEGARIIRWPSAEPPRSMFPLNSGVGAQRPPDTSRSTCRRVQALAVVLRQAAGPASSSTS